MTIKVTITHLAKDANRPVKAFADVLIDNSVVIHSVGIIENEVGRHISMPHSTWTNKDGEKLSRDMVHPISSSARKEITDAVLGAYDTYKINNLKI